jgi:hypothetical protein
MMFGRISILISLILALAVATVTQGPAQPQPQHSESTWQTSYWNNQTLSESPALVRSESDINYDWGSGSPAPGVINADGFSAHWTGRFDLPAGSYRFTLTVDDGARLWVNDHLLIDTWRDQAAQTYNSDIYLPAGRPNPNQAGLL